MEKAHNCYFCKESFVDPDDGEFYEDDLNLIKHKGEIVTACDNCMVLDPSADGPMVDTDSIQDHAPAEYFTERLGYDEDGQEDSAYNDNNCCLV